MRTPPLIILADPPWRYDFCREIDGRKTQPAIEAHYPTMGLDEIKAYDVPMASDAVLFLWATSPKLKEAMEVLGAWGFEYVTSMMWDKDDWGMGYWTRIQHELVLIGRRGSVSPPRLQVGSIIREKKTRHSAKPKRLYSIIEKMFPLSEKVELFARERRAGWQSFGNQLPSSTQQLLEEEYL